MLCYFLHYALCHFLSALHFFQSHNATHQHCFARTNFTRVALKRNRRQKSALDAASIQYFVAQLEKYFCYIGYLLDQFKLQPEIPTHL